MKNVNKKLEVRFHLSEENYEALKKLSEKMEMSISAFTKLQILNIINSEKIK